MSSTTGTFSLPKHEPDPLASVMPSRSNDLFLRRSGMRIPARVRHFRLSNARQWPPVVRFRPTFATESNLVRMPDLRTRPDGTV